MSILGRILAILLTAALCLTGAALAEQEIPFATIGDAMASEGFTGFLGGDEEHYVAVVEQDGKVIRLVADIDDEAKRLGDAIIGTENADDLEAAFEAYNAYVTTLPVAYAEEITAGPLPQEEQDALAGKTLLELEEAGFEASSAEEGPNGEAIYTVKYGVFAYDLVLDVSYDEYSRTMDGGNYGGLKAVSASCAGLSDNVAELRFRADGTFDPEKDPFAAYNDLMGRITEALNAGKSAADIVKELGEEMPDQAETIEMLVEVLSMMGGGGD